MLGETIIVPQRSQGQVPVPEGMDIDTRAFRQGMSDGIRADDPRYDIGQTINEQVLVDIVLSLANQQRNGTLDDYRLRHDVGEIMGYVVRAVASSLSGLRATALDYTVVE
jgi:hypothetical protein